jgi:hypothetical protein
MREKGRCGNRVDGQPIVRSEFVYCGNVGRHECGEVVAKSSNLLVDVDKKGIRGPETENLNCAVWDLVKM